MARIIKLSNYFVLRISILSKPGLHGSCQLINTSLHLLRLPCETLLSRDGGGTGYAADETSLKQERQPNESGRDTHLNESVRDDARP